MRKAALLGAVLLLGAGGAAITAPRVDLASAHSARPAASLHGTDVFAAGMRRVLPFRLRDQTGHVVSQASIRGRVTAITFLDSLCHKECPIVGRELASAQRQLGSRTPLDVIVVSIDPGGDTPKRAQAFIRTSGIRGPWHWLFGTHRQLKPVWNEYGIQVQPVPGDILHTAALYLVDRHGWVRVADAASFIPSQLAGSIRLLDSAGH